MMKVWKEKETGIGCCRELERRVGGIEMVMSSLLELFGECVVASIIVVYGRWRRRRGKDGGEALELCHWQMEFKWWGVAGFIGMGLWRLQLARVFNWTSLVYDQLFFCATDNDNDRP